MQHDIIKICGDLAVSSCFFLLKERLGVCLKKKKPVDLNHHVMMFMYCNCGT